MDKKAHKKNRKGFLIIFLKEEYTFCGNVYSEKELQRITKQRQHGSEWTDDCHHFKELLILRIINIRFFWNTYAYAYLSSLRIALLRSLSIYFGQLTYTFPKCFTQ